MTKQHTALAENTNNALKNSAPTQEPIPLFPLGKVVATPNALACLTNYSRMTEQLLLRHQSGDWGDVHEEDAEANVDAVNNSHRIISSYEINSSGQMIWIITEADRTVTTLLLPDDY